jgi:hypothetical protein
MFILDATVEEGNQKSFLQNHRETSEGTVCGGRVGEKVWHKKQQLPEQDGVYLEESCMMSPGGDKITTNIDCVPRAWSILHVLHTY